MAEFQKKKVLCHGAFFGFFFSHTKGYEEEKRNPFFLAYFLKALSSNAFVAHPERGNNKMLQKKRGREISATRRQPKKKKITPRPVKTPPLLNPLPVPPLPNSNRRYVFCTVVLKKG